MKLKNKRTGEIATLTLSTNGEDMIIMGNDMLAHITKLSELNDYEDYEEPKESKEPKKYWFINSGGETVSYYEEDEEPEDTEACKEIGNYFETEEEAEKAVEKLKALTEAKEDGLKIKGYYYNHEDLVILADIGKCNKLTLDTLFGKEID